MNLSVIIPTFNEAPSVERAIQSAWRIEAKEVIVVDGGSRDETCAIAEANRAVVITSKAGRGPQLNEGAKIANGQVLTFLHADNALTPECGEQLQTYFEDPEHHFACFRQTIENQAAIYRWIERGNCLRARFQKLPYGDQGITVTRQAFESVGGFDEIPLMEDVRFSQKLSRRYRPEILPGPLLVDDRRWRQQGPIRQTFRNWWTMLRYRFGATPQRLAQSYRKNDLTP